MIAKTGRAGHDGQTLSPRPHLPTSPTSPMLTGQRLTLAPPNLFPQTRRRPSQLISLAT